MMVEESGVAGLSSEDVPYSTTKPEQPVEEFQILPVPIATSSTTTPHSMEVLLVVVTQTAQ